jgi:outer membrane lipoprotein SlyB
MCLNEGELTMRTRITAIAGASALLALAACTTSPRVEVNVPPQPAYSTTTVVPAPVATAPAGVVAPVGVEYGRITNIDYYAGGVSRSAPNVPGAVLGAVAGAALGNQIGHGTGRAAATVLGGAAGAAVGSNVGRTDVVTDAVYRITVQTDNGVIRYFDVPATGDLRVGDRVRVDNGVIYRS